MMDNAEKSVVSIIMPAYNSDRYIEKTINSVLNQTYENFELIIVDDGSNDETLHVAETYAGRDARIKVFSQVNQGVSAARNKGLDEIRGGTYVAFLDSDDLWDESFLEVMVRQIEHKKCDMIYCETDIINSDGSIEHISSPLIEGNIFSYVTKRNEIRFPFHISGILIRNSVLECHSIRFDVGVAIMEDIGFYIKLLSVTEAFCVPGVMSHYCKHELSATTSMFNPHKWRGSVDIFKYAEPFIRRYQHNNLDKYYKIWDYYAYRFIWGIVKDCMYNDAIEYIDVWEKNLNRFQSGNNRLNDRIKCSLLLLRNRRIMKMLNLFKRK